MYAGKDGHGPASYIPSKFYDSDGKEIVRPDIQNSVKYDSVNYHITIGSLFFNRSKPQKGEVRAYL